MFGLFRLFTLLAVFVSITYAKQPMIFFSVGIKLSQKGISKIYAETSSWLITPKIPMGIGADAGIEIGKSIEIYGETEVGWGFLGYSHGLYYRIPLSLHYGNSYGQRGKLWFIFLPIYLLDNAYSSSHTFYAAIDLDYENRDFEQYSLFINFHNKGIGRLSSTCVMPGDVCGQAR